MLLFLLNVLKKLFYYREIWVISVLILNITIVIYIGTAGWFIQTSMNYPFVHHTSWLQEITLVYTIIVNFYISIFLLLLLISLELWRVLTFLGSKEDGFFIGILLIDINIVEIAYIFILKIIVSLLLLLAIKVEKIIIILRFFLITSRI